TGSYITNETYRVHYDELNKSVRIQDIYTHKYLKFDGQWTINYNNKDTEFKYINYSLYIDVDIDDNYTRFYLIVNKNNTLELIHNSTFNNYNLLNVVHKVNAIQTYFMLYDSNNIIFDKLK